MYAWPPLHDACADANMMEVPNSRLEQSRRREAICSVSG